LYLTVAVVFLNEAQYLPRLLDSIDRQSRPPDRLLLVDDGSDDASLELARRFAAGRPYARALARPRRRRDADRLAAAAELRAFLWAVAKDGGPFDVVAKLDGDLELGPAVFERLVGAFERDPQLGIAGFALSVAGPDGTPVRERSAPWHVRGATKFYRRACWDQITPLPPILGWDTIDESRAELRGWRVSQVMVPGGDSLHLRVTGSYDGRIRGFRRRGMAAWGYGAHPLQVLASGAVRMRERPPVVGGLAYLQGWVGAARSGAPRAEPEVVAHLRARQLERLRRRLPRGRS
jgi:biofilm PGA synthesis N-glycosyltransferase PgaC